MKKLLILLSLTTAMTAFADTPTILPSSNSPQGNSAISSELNITARVIKPLTIKATDMAFGDIIQGTTATAEGRYSIKGEPNQPIVFTLTDLSELNGPNNSTLAINMGQTLSLPTHLDEKGELIHVLKGVVSPTLDTPIGNYTGKIIARVQYQ